MTTGSKTITILHDGERITHIASDYAGYVTLCGCDGNDSVVGQLPSKIQRVKVTCGHCWDMWQTCREFKAGDFRIKK